MARVIVILLLMIAITASMFWITRKPEANAGVTVPTPTATSATPNATVPLAELNAPPQSRPEDDLQDKPGDAQSATSVDPRPVTNAPDALSVASGPPAAAPADGGSPTASAQDVTSGPVAGAAPAIGTAGIDRNNKASFTGTATPGSAVALAWDGGAKPIAETKADAAGNWALEFKAPDTSKEHELTVSSKDKDQNAVVGPQRAFIGPPTAAGSLPQITLKSVDEGTKLADKAAGAVSDAAKAMVGAAVAGAKDLAANSGDLLKSGGPQVGLVIAPVTGEDHGAFHLSGKADPGAKLKFAINGKAAGETVAAADGSWSVVAKNASGKPAERLRVLLTDAAGKKLEETEVPLTTAVAENVPAAKGAASEAKDANATTLPAPETKVAAAETPSTPETKVAEPVQPPAAQPAQPEPPKAVDTTASVPAVEAPRVHDKPRRHVIRVRAGDSLWSIARRHLGNGRKWARFYRLNKHKIDNPDLIFPGQTLILPG